MKRAVGDFLEACGVDPSNPDLKGTPTRVARLWQEDLLSGYAIDPAEVTARPITGESDPEVVLVSGLRFHAVCPHHLLPFCGVAAVAYFPAGRLLGFGNLARLVDCFTRRLTLQERATHDIAAALMEHLGSPGAGCVLRASQQCLAVPDDRHEASEVVTSAFLGSMRRRTDLKERLLQATTALPPEPRGSARRRGR